MADFDVSIIAKLIDQVTAPAQAVADSLNRIRDSARNVAEGALANLRTLERWGNTGRTLGSHFTEAFANINKGWQNLKLGAMDAYRRVTEAITGIWATVRRAGIFTGLTLTGIGWAFHSWAAGQQAIAATAESLGIGVQKWKEWDYAARQANVSMEAITTSLPMFMNQLDEARKSGSGRLYESLMMPGRRQEETAAKRELLKDLMAAPDTTTAFEALLDRMKGGYADAWIPILQDLGFMRNTARQIFLLAQSPWRERMAQQREILPPFSEAETDKINRYNEAWQRVIEGFRELQRVAFMPFLDVITKQFGDLSAAMRPELPHSAEGALHRIIREWSTTLSQGLEGMLATFDPAKWEDFKNKINTYIIDPLTALSKVTGGWTNLALLAAGLWLLGPAIQTLVGVAQILYFGSPFLAGLAALGLLGYGIWYNWDKVHSSFIKLNTALKELTGIDLTKIDFNNLLSKFNEGLANQIAATLTDIATAMTTIKNIIEKPFDWSSWAPFFGLPNIGGIRTPWGGVGTKEFMEGTKPPVGPAKPVQGPPGIHPYEGLYGPQLPKKYQDRLVPEIFSQHLGGGLYGPSLPKKYQDRLTPEFGTHPPGNLPGALRKVAPSVPSSGGMWDWLRRFSPIGSAAAATPSAMPASFTPSFTPMPAGPSIGGGPSFYSGLKGAMDDLIGTKPAALGANAPIAGTPPTGITIQARGPNVHISQAPPNVNVAVTVNVLKPDDAPITTAMSVAEALSSHLEGSTAMGPDIGV